MHERELLLHHDDEVPHLHIPSLLLRDIAGTNTGTNTGTATAAAAAAAAAATWCCRPVWVLRGLLI